MAATRTGPAARVADALLKAAIALPIVTLPVKAGQLEAVSGGVKYLHYAEENGRIKVEAPMLWVQGPLGKGYDLSASAVVDSVSGASPRYVGNQGGKPVHTLSSASIVDSRRAADVKLTRHLDHMSLGLGAAVSSEHDYLSRAAGIDLRLNMNDRLTTLAVGTAIASDTIGSSVDRTLNEHRLTRDYFVGITQVIDTVSLVQSNLSYSDGAGYYNDPYKYTLTFLAGQPSPVLHNDARPGQRGQVAWLTRYRHYQTAWRSALAIDYRYFMDDWGIRAHALDVSWSKDLGNGWKLRPGLRYYSQSQADFYATTFASPTGLGSSDQRLASFGALTPSLKLIKAIDATTSLDITGAYYRQSAGLKAGGGGSADLAPFAASYVMLGITRRF